MADASFLAWPFFDEAHRRLKARLDPWAAAEIAPYEHDEHDVDALARRFVERLGTAGWLRHCVPATHGGVGETLDVRSLCLLRESLAYRSGLADFAFAMQGLGSASISLFGAPALQAEYLPGVAAGKQIAAFALSEPESGSDVAALKCGARREGGDYVIDGRKTWISNAGIADHYVVFARTGEAPGAKGLSAFVVDARTPGLRIAERIPVMAPHPLGTLDFTGCRVPAGHMLGGPGEGFKVAMATLDIFRATVGAAALGFARRALDEALGRAQTRASMGKPLAEHQLIQEKLAEMALKVDAAALLVYRAAWVKDRLGQRVSREASMAKLYATEAAQEVIDAAVQIFGGLGVVTGVPVERLYREIRALRIYEGTSEIQKLVIAAQTLAATKEASHV
ncbi:MAG TPA: acyl-CoA dehydrogenase family protein [Alphaproteobacteria bacterium]|nr:acyl-CoA dehydrogenase family protein [Alphaproteobacteria bacterium]